MNCGGWTKRIMEWQIEGEEIRVRGWGEKR
jgi:hypothetical protein